MSNGGEHEILTQKQVTWCFRDALEYTYIGSRQPEGDVDGLIGGLKIVAAKKRSIKQGVMQQLLTGKVRLIGAEAECVA